MGSPASLPSSSLTLLGVPEDSHCSTRLTWEIPVYSIIWHNYKIMAVKRKRLFAVYLDLLCKITMIQHNAYSITSYQDENGRLVFVLYQTNPSTHPHRADF